MAETIRVDGLKELDRQLAKLEKATGGKVLKGALMDAARPIWKAARTNAEATGIRGQDAGALAAAMGRWAKIVNKRRVIVFIGPRKRSKKGLAVYNAKHGTDIRNLVHAHMVEFGTMKDPAQPYMRPAFEQNKLIAAQRFGKRLAERILKVTRTR